MAPDDYEPDPRDMTVAELLARGWGVEFTAENGLRPVPPRKGEGG